MTVYCKGQPGELPEILDFINMVFSMHRVPHNFRTLLPKLYGADRQTEWCHYCLLYTSDVYKRQRDTPSICATPVFTTEMPRSTRPDISV